MKRATRCRGAGRCVSSRGCRPESQARIAQVDLPGALIQIRRALKPDGLFLAVLPGGDTLAELRHAWLMAESALAGGAGPRDP